MYVWMRNFPYAHPERVIVVEDGDLYWRVEVKGLILSHELAQKKTEELVQQVPEIYRSALANLVMAYVYSSFATGGGDSPSRYTNQIPGLNVKVKHPVVDGSFSLSTVIMDLNDTHRWTREQIADWLETLDENPILNNPKENENV